MLVEDEQDTRRLIAEALRDSGLAVVEAADGPAALRMLGESGGAPPDFLLADIGLPGGMNGRQLSDAARRLLPGLPVLLVTGYAGAAKSPDLPAGIQVLSKPFHLDALVARVREPRRRAKQGGWLTPPPACVALEESAGLAVNQRCQHFLAGNQNAG